MKSIFLIFLSCLWLFAGSVGKPTPVVIGEVYDLEPAEPVEKGDEKEEKKQEIKSSERYYSFTMKENGNIFIVNPNPEKTHRYRIYNDDFKLIESDTVKESKAESLYRGKYLYHNVSGAFSIFSNKLK